MLNFGGPPLQTEACVIMMRAAGALQTLAPSAGEWFVDPSGWAFMQSLLFLSLSLFYFPLLMLAFSAG